MKGLQLLLAAALALGSTGTALAAQPEAGEVDRLMEVMRMQQTLDSLWPQIEAMQVQALEQFADEDLDAEARASVQESLERNNALMREAMSWEKVRPVYRDIYQRTFDADDVQAMVEFYSSPTGQRVLDKTPQLMANTMAATQQLLIPLVEQMKQDLQEAAGVPATEADATP